MKSWKIMIKQVEPITKYNIIIITNNNVCVGCIVVMIS